MGTTINILVFVLAVRGICKIGGVLDVAVHLDGLVRLEGGTRLVRGGHVWREVYRQRPPGSGGWGRLH